MKVLIYFIHYHVPRRVFSPYTYGNYIINHPNWDAFVQGHAKLEKMLGLQAYSWTVLEISGYKVPICAYLLHPQHHLSLDLFLSSSVTSAAIPWTLCSKKEMNKSPSYHL